MSLWYQDVGPWHNNHRYRGQGLLRWAGMDTKELFLENTRDPHKRQKLGELGWLDLDAITYRLNHQGFRCDEFDERPAGLALGCSHTMGIGIPEEHTWPCHLSQLLGVHVWNLGVGGSGLDSNFRLLDHYLPILRPKFVVHAMPHVARVEYYGFGEFKTIIAHGLSGKFPFRDFFLEYFFNDVNSDINARKNLLAIKYLCGRAEIPYYLVDVTESMIRDGAARDLAHAGSTSQKKFAEIVLDLMKENPQGAQDGHTRIRCS